MDAGLGAVSDYNFRMEFHALKLRHIWVNRLYQMPVKHGVSGDFHIELDTYNVSG